MPPLRYNKGMDTKPICIEEGCNNHRMSAGNGRLQKRCTGHHRKKYNMPNYSKFQKRQYVLKYPEKAKAKHVIGHLVKTGKICKLPCEICGDKISQAHHPDYDKPIEVVWLCQIHHTKIHILP